ncbi:hypothetical protein pSal_SNUABM02_046 [Salmonella phage pSal-SNUABM-02]|nr:hypothetical protein pSal_SNUABM02_046 [Salmonella phage pSal-SNUABM-02]
MIFFTIIGGAVCAGVGFFVLAILYWFFVHPLFQAVSLTRWNIACGKATNIDFTNYPYWKVFKGYYSVGGWPGERTWNSIGEWRGIGRWQVFKSEDEEAP